MFRIDVPTCYATASEAAEVEPMYLPLMQGLSEAAKRHDFDAAAAVAPGDLLPTFADGHSSVLLVALPERARADVAALLEGDVEVYNEVSDDLLRSVTLLSLVAGENELRLATSQLITPALDYGKQSLVVVVSAGESVWRRHLVPNDLTDLCDALQAAEMSYGENYRPYRIFSKQELKEAHAAARQPTKEAKTYVPLPFVIGR